MKHILFVSIGLFAFFGKSALSQNCVSDQCLPANKGCDRFYQSHKITVPDENNKPDCTGTHGAGKLVYCCATQQDATEQRAEMAKTRELKSMKTLARTIMGAEPNEYPHQVHFRTRGMCGGTVYNKNWIITAAHCVRYGNDPNNYTSSTGQYRWKPNGDVKQAYVIAGLSHVADAPEANKYYIDQVIWHENWNPTQIGYGYDIALLHLKKPLALEKGKIQPMKLESANYIPNYGGNGVVIGFGNVNEKLGSASDDLMETVGPIHHPATGIRISFDPLNAEPMGTKLNHMHLAIGGGESGVIVGQGDSGGPFICADDNNKPILCGIASFKSCDPFVMCKKPSYFQRLAPMLGWIKNNTNNERQEEELFFDEPLFPQKVQNKKVPKSLVRIIHREKACTGVIVTSTMILTTADCMTNPDFSKAHPIVYHFASEDSLDYQGTGAGALPDFQPNVSKNVSHYLEKPFNRNDMGFLLLTTPVPADYAVKLAPVGYQMKGRSAEYTFNEVTNSVEKRNFLEMDKEDCASKLRSVDRNLELTPDQLCMRQVYSAEKDCKRDLGGMLLCENGKYLCGIGSFHACKANGFPEIFTNYLSGRDTMRADLDVNMEANP
ncbi:unnamed protein product [Orchesella dallaii]|uniref:Peptidase S1 domain-containing protein n=1 Tax=Orchesella dallaii TaxID=48710 RepID=A0ABP1Q3H2_9HEXA